MSTRGKIWLASIVFSLVAWTGLILTASAADAPAAKIKVLSWVHVWGCPRPASDVVLWVQDGDKIRIVHVKIDILSDMEKKKLVEMIGDVEGINIQYKCGNEI
jgi:hypothetical protein